MVCIQMYGLGWVGQGCVEWTRHPVVAELMSVQSNEDVVIIVIQDDSLKVVWGLVTEVDGDA